MNKGAPLDKKADQLDSKEYRLESMNIYVK